jgi:hypothetical protein
MKGYKRPLAWWIKRWAMDQDIARDQPIQRESTERRFTSSTAKTSTRVQKSQEAPQGGALFGTWHAPLKAGIQPASANLSIRRHDNDAVWVMTVHRKANSYGARGNAKIEGDRAEDTKERAPALDARRLPPRG